ncbi:Sec-independent protein translocase protein TatB [Dyella sp. 20L07]|uniref:Sec-independent protein translocase protein TatB n=1 Tax=Dyella sp. 20L07 TaxID=3384240 RepID=UPI003D2E309D
MIEISFGKLVLLALVALIVLGPEKLPGAARTAGALLRRVRTGWDSVRAEVERELQVEEIRRQAREAAARAEAAQAELDETLRKMRPVGNTPTDAPSPPTTEPAPAAVIAETTSAKEVPHGGA